MGLPDLFYGNRLFDLTDRMFERPMLPAFEWAENSMHYYTRSDGKTKELDIALPIHKDLKAEDLEVTLANGQLHIKTKAHIKDEKPQTVTVKDVEESKS